ncbi:hypothetical protein BGX38DRAFT_773473 [Terfezia claveryi]|nr:hypothetical protein BGX38DRAFT_773473 [Terfezia claveryi]
MSISKMTANTQRTPKLSPSEVYLTGMLLTPEGAIALASVLHLNDIRNMLIVSKAITCALKWFTKGSPLVYLAPWTCGGGNSIRESCYCCGIRVCGACVSFMFVPVGVRVELVPGSGVRRRLCGTCKKLTLVELRRRRIDRVGPDPVSYW